MRYVIERHGGFAGLRKQRSFQAGELDPAERDLLDRLLRTRRDQAAAPVGADRFSYRIVRESDEGRQEIVAPDLMELQDLLRRHSPAPRGG